ncbi:MAG: zinc metalloprotease HtpX [Alkalispirochaeta sp.]
MSRIVWSQRAFRLVQSLVLAGIIVYLSVRAATIMFGPVGGWSAVLLVSVISLRSLGTQRLFLPSGSFRLQWSDAPDLYRTVRTLSERGGLSFPPQVYVLPSPEPQAMTTGTGPGATILVTRGLLELLSFRELRGVIAHEIAHIVNRDLPLFAVLGAMQMLTRFVATTLMAIVLFAFPMLLMGLPVVDPEALLYLSFVPIVSLLLQPAFLRTREFQADLRAAELTEDPDALASALVKIEGVRRSLWQRWLTRGPVAGDDLLSRLLNTHPGTGERVRRLQELRKAAYGLRRPTPVIAGPRRRW